MRSEKLGNFLREVSNWQWDEFAKAEKNNEYSTNQSIIFGLIRACAMQKMEAIKISLNRIDGKLKTPIKIEYPKIFYLYPHAKGVEQISYTPGQKTGVELAISPGVDLIKPVELPEVESKKRDLPSMGLRETLTEMADCPRELPEAIIALALQTEQWIRGQAPRPQEIPRVKSVVAAHLLTMAQNRNMDALNEVFDQIDGKLVETLQVIGEDVYITSYVSEAPHGAVLNADGIYQLEATQSQNLWAQKLGRVE